MTDPNVNPQGGGTSDPPAWTAQLKDDLKSNTFFTQFGSVTDVGKFALEADGRLKEADGKLKNAVILPGEGSKDEDWNPVWGKLGKPEKPDGYQLKKSDKWPEGIPYDENEIGWFRNMAHRHNLTQKMAEGIYNDYQELFIQAAKKQQEVLENEKNAALETMKKEWGEDGWKTNLALAGKAMETFGGPELKKFLDDSKLGNHPEMIKLFVTLGKAVSEDSFVKGKGGGEKSQTKTGVLSYPSMEAKK